MTKIRVLLADDHTVVREGLKALVSCQPDMEVIGEASNGRVAWKSAIELQPNVVVMDLTMPELGGIEATELIRRDCPSARVLALTVHEVDSYLGRLLRAGATGYVLKRAAAEELVRAIRLVASGGICIDPQIAAQAVKGFSSTETAGSTGEKDLTEREAQVVKLLARGHINREIAQHLDLSVKTIEVHKARALEKLGLKSRADLVQYALRRGWLEPKQG
jgi:DNA-binding NarL/FixJ family response regulator